MPWDDAALDGLRDEMGRAGIREVRLWDNRPPVEIDLSGMETLILLDRVSDPILSTAIDVARAAGTYRPKDSAESDDDDEDDDAIAARADADEAAAEVLPGEPTGSDAKQETESVWQTVKSVTRWQDQVCHAVFVSPKWCPMDEIPQGARPKGMLCIFDLTPAQRRYIVDLAFQGVAALDTFRTGADSDNRSLHGGGLRNDAGGPDPQPGPPALPEVVAERGDLAAREGGGTPRLATAGRRRA